MSNYIGVVTITTSFIWLLGTRINSNLIEGISRNNDLYNRRIWVSNSNLIEAIRIIDKIIDLLTKESMGQGQRMTQIHSLGQAQRLAQMLTLWQHGAMDEAVEGVKLLEETLHEKREEEEGRALDIAISIQNILNSDLAIQYYKKNLLRPGKSPNDNEANITTNAVDFISTSPNYYSKDTIALKITQSNQLDYFAYSTQLVVGLTVVKTDNPLYLLFHLLLLTILLSEISRNYWNLKKGAEDHAPRSYIL
jgi:hypothetical protein